MNKKGYISAIIGAIFFGSAGIFVKFVYTEGFDSISLLTLQYIMAVFLLFIITLVKDKKALRITKNELVKLIILGIIGNSFMTVFYYKAYEYLPIAIVTLLLYTYPILVFLYSLIFKQSNITTKKIIAVIIAFAGCILTLNLIFGKMSYSLIGIFFGILSAVFYAFMNIYSEERLSNTPALVINFYSTLFSLISLIVYKFPSFIFKTEISLKTLSCILFLAIACEIIPLTLLYYSIKHIGAFKVSVISNLEIPTAMLLGILFLNETVNFYQVFGAILIIFAVYLIKDNSQITL